MKRMNILLPLYASAALVFALPSGASAESLHAGDYLSSHFAQNHHDWKNASIFMDNILKADQISEARMRRAMILAMGAGRAEDAIDMAKHLKESHTTNPDDNSHTLLDIFLIIEEFKNKQYDAVEARYKTLGKDGTTQFIGPYIHAWLLAAQGQADIKNLQANSSQLYHGILISDYLNDHTEIEKLIAKALSVETINLAEIERIADIYGYMGKEDKALELYNTILKTQPEDEAIQNKVEFLKSGDHETLFEKVISPQHGLAQAFHDMARILINENNDESARVFANMALYLYPDLAQTHILLAEIDLRYEQFDAAIAHYKAIKKDNPKHLVAQHEMADIYMETEQFDKAIALLEDLYKRDQNVDTLIKIGDAHRRQSNFGLALKSYNKAVKHFDGKLPKEYWHLHYVRGIAYEQSNNWKRAEEELKAALAYQPDHPYVLNYLGYAWADQGINLAEARDMIQRAVDIRPSDGYITDSLGWVMYKMQDYKNAALVLERAVELMPYDPTINDHLGDAYWQVGRYREARFQWERAKNHAEDQDVITTIEQKLSSGLE